MSNQLRMNEYVTRDVLRKELSAFEKRLSKKIEWGDAKLDTKIDAVEERLAGKISSLDVKIDSVEKRLDTKIEATAQSLKEYIDSRTGQVQTSVQQLGEKLDRRVDGLVEMIKLGFGKQAETEARLDNHEARITALGQKGT